MQGPAQRVTINAYPHLALHELDAVTTSEQQNHSQHLQLLRVERQERSLDLQACVTFLTVTVGLDLHACPQHCNLTPLLQHKHLLPFRTAVHCPLFALYGLGGWLVQRKLVPIRVLLSAIGFTFSLVFATQGVVQTLADTRKVTSSMQRCCQSVSWCPVQCQVTPSMPRCCQLVGWCPV